MVLIKPRTIHKTTSGKIKRYANKQALLADELSIVARYDANIKVKSKQESASISEFNRNLRNYIKQELAKICNVTPDQIDENTHFSELGLDSLTLIELQNKIEDYLSDYKIKFDSNSIVEYPTIATLTNFIEKQLGSSVI